MNKTWTNIKFPNDGFQSSVSSGTNSFRNVEYTGMEILSPIHLQSDDELLNKWAWDELPSTSYYKHLLEQQREYNISQIVIERIISIVQHIESELTIQQLITIKQINLDSDEYNYFELIVENQDNVVRLDVYLDDEEVYGVCNNSILVGKTNQMINIIDKLFHMS